ncbi:acyltransferase family protein [Spirosoma daeguense]
MIRKFDYIDSLRGIAILCVLINHYRPNGIDHYSVAIKNLILNTSNGVQLFYVVSAFTLFLSYSRRAEKEININTNFFIRRYFRIAPMYYVACSYYIVHRCYFSDSLSANTLSSITDWGIISNFLLIHGFSPNWIHAVVPVGWSVAVEVQFYLLIPFFVKQITNLNRAIIFLLGSVLVNTLLKLLITKAGLVAYGLNWESYVLFWLPNQLPAFACGLVLFFLITESRRKWKISPFIIYTLFIIVLLDLGSGKKFLFSDSLFFSLLFVVFTYTLSKNPTYIFVNKFTKYIGQRSYSMYLLHFPVLGLLIKLDIIIIIQNYFQSIPILSYCIPLLSFISITTFISSYFYKIIEIPFQEFGSRLIRKSENDLAIPTVAS